MQQSDQIRAWITLTEAQLYDVHRIRGRDLAHALRRARRVLPGPVRRAGAELAKAQKMLGHPQLERLLDADALGTAHEIVSEHLDSVDVADIRRSRLIRMAALLCFYVFFVAACFVIWMVRAQQI